MKLIEVINSEIKEAVKLTQDEIDKRLVLSKEIAANYKNPRQFALDHKTLWGFLRNYNLVDEVFPKRQIYHSEDYWTPETLSIEAKKYNGRAEFMRKNQYAYIKAKEFGLLDSLFPERKEPKNKVNFDVAIKVAKEFEGTRTAFMVKHPVAYRLLRDNNLLDQLLGPKKMGGPKKKFDDDELINKAKEYPTIKELRKNDMKLYHLLVSANLLYTIYNKEEENLDKARSYGNKYELLKSNRRLYKKLEASGLLDKAFAKKDLDEGRSRKELGSGVDHLVFTATDDSDIVYKLGPKIAVDYWFEDFKKNPEIFPKVYKRGKTKIKLKSEKSIITSKGKFKTFPVGTFLPLDYVKLEKLDTDRVQKEWDILDNVVEEIMEIDDYGFLDFLIVYLTFRPENKVRGHHGDETIDRISGQVKQHYPNVYPMFMKYVELTNKIKAVKPGVPDLHRYNFGYDKEGKLKCLDF